MVDDSFSLSGAMDLFAAAGIDLGDGGRGGRPARSGVSRTLRIPLFNHKVVAEARKPFTFDPTERQVQAAASYAKTAKSPKFARQKETAVRNLFFEKVLGEILVTHPSTLTVPIRLHLSGLSAAARSMSRSVGSALPAATKKLSHRSS